jgi:hypothetical protein
LEAVQRIEPDGPSIEQTGDNTAALGPQIDSHETLLGHPEELQNFDV